ncbi:ribosomal silencing factor RsfS-like protein, 312 [Lycorma delicatula]|uniref:ribosomal silencing factor RsfS-like protein, 312 n=1 Tax=Lycorma delicatula TaxID=130591 RepID=UPI003F5164C1
MLKSLMTSLGYSKLRFILPLRSCSYDTEFMSALNKSGFCFFPNRTFCHKNGDDKSLQQEPQNVKSDTVSVSVLKSGKYELFKDENAPLILDVVEERQRIQDSEEAEEEYDEFAGLNLERGVSGVFDIEDLVKVLQRENAKDIFVVSLPSYLRYVDYIVVVTGRSLKHMLGLAEFVRRLYKIKRNKTDLIPKLEGETSKDWHAIDLGNIALHIMNKKARIQYDLESLWALGKEFDEKSNTPSDPLAEILKKHSISLDDFQPVDKLG